MSTLQLPQTMTVKLPTDREGFMIRQCSAPSCKRRFRVKPGTGLPGTKGCYCPYCGVFAESARLSTKAQLDYVKKVAGEKVSESVGKYLSGMADRINRAGRGGLLSVRASVKSSPSLRPAYHESFSAEGLTELACKHCTLQFSVIGAASNCPDCGKKLDMQSATPGEP